MPTKEDVDHQRELLAIHRGTLAHYLKQRAALSEAHTPPGVAHGIKDARKNIKNIKQILRNWGETVDDMPGDGDGQPVTPDASSPDVSGKQAVLNAPTENIVTPTQIEPTIGIVTALSHENVAMKSLLQHVREPEDSRWRAGWRYLIGETPSSKGGVHQVVLARVDQGNNQAASRATLLLERFPTLQAIIMVGIAGGVPEPSKAETHVRLGDIVVSNKYGVVQYDFIKREADGSATYRHVPRAPSAILLEGIDALAEASLEGRRPWISYITEAIKNLEESDDNWDRPAITKDILHDESGKVVPPPYRKRPNEPQVFFGAIASANTLLKDRTVRNALQQQFGVKAVEMEGSGVADAAWNHSIGYLVVRGICDYCDDEKGDEWQNYAAIVAAAYTRALLEAVPAVKAVAVGGGDNGRDRDEGKSVPSSPSKQLELKARNRLADLLVNTGKAEAGSRSALCRRIGVESSRLSFVARGSDQDFATELVNFLNTNRRYIELEALCDEIAPELGDPYQQELKSIREKIVVLQEN